MKYKIKLFSIDLDGTLLFTKNNPNKRNFRSHITPTNLEALEKFLNFDKHIVFASGRNLGRILNYVDLIAEKINYQIPYIIALNGALVYDNINKKFLKLSSFHPIQLKNLIGFLNKNNYVFFLQKTKQIETKFVDKIYYVNRWFLAVFLRRKFHNSNPEKFRLKNFNYQNFSKLTIVTVQAKSVELQQKLMENFGDYFEFFIVNKRVIEVSPKDVDKWTALLSLAAYLNLRSNEIAAIGDQENDYTSIKYSGFGIAVDQRVGDYLLHLKNDANFVTENFDGNAVANAIGEMEKLGLF